MAKRRWRWAVLIACAWLESLNGSTYIFSTYSQAMKERLGLDQRSVGTISFFVNLGSSIGIAPSLLVQWQIPAWITALLGIAHSSLGFGLTWIAMYKRQITSTWALGAFQFLAANSQIYVQTAVLVRCVRAFPLRRGPVVGLLKGFMGVSASILVQIFQFACGDDQVCIPLLLTWLLPSLSAIPLLILAAIPEAQDLDQCREDLDPEGDSDADEEWRLNALSTILILLAAFLFVILLTESVAEISRTGVCAVIGAILLSPILVAAGAKRNGAHKDDGDSANDILIGSAEAVAVEAVAIEAPVASRPSIGDDFSIVQALSCPDFWLLLLLLLVGSGCSSAVEGSIAQLGASLGYGGRAVDVCVSLFSVSSCVARIASGVGSERLLRSRGTPRPAFLAISSLALAGGAVWAAAAAPGALYGASFLVGAADGIFWCITIAVASELFGLASFGTLLNILTASCPIGSYFFSVVVVGSLYDRNTSGAGILCYGSRCFASAYAILAAVCILAALLASVLAAKTRPFYCNKRDL